ncbi:predicted protein [Plenodomus lingam JN3]|uniref:Predicted protein n=1 Tax=Leptosphaeria maculans (strain JN3 / isolate v23.1.3 / race Av1-4-5-6-7-8) TaxID=985895 RepID=E5AD57_LEPMJ|nr:predicted protein [Plenodomus lingam JN3]CBY02409.1 predicted protein [Plenodomus lingam JN3]
MGDGKSGFGLLNPTSLVVSLATAGEMKQDELIFRLWTTSCLQYLLAQSRTTTTRAQAFLQLYGNPAIQLSLDDLSSTIGCDSPAPTRAAYIWYPCVLVQVCTIFLSIGSMTASIIATPAKADQNRSFPLPMGAGHVRSQRSRLSGYRRRKQATTTAPCSDYSSWAASASSDSCIFTLHTCLFQIELPHAFSTSSTDFTIDNRSEGGARGGGSAHLLVLSSRHNGTRMMAAFGATPLVYHYCRTGKDFGRRASVHQDCCTKQVLLHEHAFEGSPRPSYACSFFTSWTWALARIHPAVRFASTIIGIATRNLGPSRPTVGVCECGSRRPAVPQEYTTP